MAQSANMKASVVVVVALNIIVGVLISPVYGGNHLDCSVNYCENDGLCVVMSQSPSPTLYLKAKAESAANLHYSEDRFPDWSAAATYCATQKAMVLLDPGDDPRLRLEAQRFVATHWTVSPEASFWIGAKQCQIMRKNADGTFDIRTCSSDSSGGTFNVSRAVHATDINVISYPALCHARAASEADNPPFIYACQCRNGFGLENCTVPDPGLGDSTINPGVTYCQQQTSVVRLDASTSTGKILYVDHAIYGRPLLLPGSLTPGGANICKSDFFAQFTDDFCVAPNSLAAVTYWCQGKIKCEFDAKWIAEGATSKQYFTLR